MKVVWGATPKACGQLFEGGGNRMSTACAISLTRMEEGRRDGVERNRSARWIGRKIATRAGFTSLIRMQGQITRVEIARGPLQVQSWTLRQLDYGQLDYAGCEE